MAGKYRVFGAMFDRIFRNNLNANFDDIDTDIQAQKTRVDNLIVGTPQPSEVVDARGGLPVLKDRLDGFTMQLADMTSKKADVTYVDSKIGNIGNTKTFKGSILFASLPTSGNTAGDYWYVTDKTTNYCWNGSSWADIGNNVNLGDGTIDLNNLTDTIKTNITKGMLNGDILTYALNPKLGYISGAGAFSTASLYAAVIMDIIPNGNDIIIKFNKPYNWRKRTWNTSGTMNGTFVTGTSQTIVLSKYQTDVSKYALEIWGVNDAWGTVYNNSFLADVRSNMVMYSDVKPKFYQGAGTSATTGTTTFYLLNLNATTGCVSSVFPCKTNMILKNKRPDLYKIWVYANKTGLSYFDYLGSKTEYDLSKYVGMDMFIEIRHLSDNTYTDGMVDEVKNVFDITYKHKYDALSDITFYKGLFKNVICCGDSLTEGDQGSGPVNRITSFNYPYFLRQVTNWTVTNAGSSGITTQTYWNTIAAGGQNADVTIGTGQTVHRFIPSSFTAYDTMILYLGTNGGLTDTLDTDCPTGTPYTSYANTNTGSYCKIIEKSRADNPSINIILVKIWTGADPVGVTTTNVVIDKIAAKYNLFIIESNDPQFTDLNNKVYHPYDIHMSNIGYLNFANYVMKELCKICAVNESYFKITTA